MDNNTNHRLNRSSSDAMIGGVAAGLGHYFQIDPTWIRVAFLLLMFVTGGTFLLVYLALWILIPATGSTASDANQIIHENMNEISAKARNFAGNPTYINNPGNPGNPAQPQPQLTQNGSTVRARQGAGPAVLIAVGVFFLLMNMGIFRAIHWGMWWPLLLIGLGVLFLNRRNRPY